MALLIARKNFKFTVLIKDVQFNNIGSYYLKLSAQSSFSSDYSGLWVKDLTSSDDFQPGFTVQTDIVNQENKKAFCHFKKNSFAFFLPKGFCSNDSDHDVYLAVEAFQLGTGTTKQERRVGECKYAIFPRTNKPKANLSAIPGENMYKHTDVWTLLRTTSTGNLQMHCGRLQCVTTFSEMTDPPVKTPRAPPPRAPTPKKTPPKQKSPDPEPEPKGGKGKVVHSPVPRESPKPVARKTPEEPWFSADDFVLPDPPRSPSPTFGYDDLDDRRTVVESPHEAPPGEIRPRAQSLLSGEQHVARPDMEDIVVILHGAANLPSLKDGQVPQPYCILKTKSDEEQRSQVISKAAAEPSHSPSYQQGFVVEYKAQNAPHEVLMMQFADKNTRELLITYKLSVSMLQPFHQYHLEMVMPAHHSPGGVRVFATMMRRTSNLPRDPSSPNFIALEVYLQAVEYKMKNPAGRLIAVSRIVPDYYSYNWISVRNPSTVIDNLIHNGGVTLTTVTFPSPHPALFAVPDSNKQGYPQITLPGGPPDQPVWDHSFLFSHQRDKATLFTPSAALVIEYFEATKAMSDLSWRLKNPVGFSTLLLDQGVYKQLSADSAKTGVQVRKLPIQGTILRTFHEKAPTVGLILRLITSERPRAVTVPTDPDALPHLEYVPQEQRDITNKVQQSMVSLQQPNYSIPDWNHSDLNLRSPSPEQTIEKYPGYWFKQRVLKSNYPVQDGEGLPPHNAMESILPEYQYIFVDPDNKKHNHGPMGNTTSRVPDDMDKTSLHLLDHQMHELEKYRSAVHKMGEDILTLRREIRDLETNNSHLRSDLSKYNDSTKLMLDSQELDGLTKPELAARYVSLKQKLTSQTGELRDYKDRVQQLHNQLIKHNDKEKEYLKVTQAHTSQNELLHKLQDKAQKVKRLEDACKKQEKVIEKMERLLTKKAPKDTPSNVLDLRTEALTDENKRLRHELDEYKEQNRLLSIGKGIQANDDEEKLHLYEKLERSESRIRSLENQLAENARKWGHEKSDLTTKLQETELGLRRMNPLSIPKKPTLYSYDAPLREDPRRYSKAPPRRAHAAQSLQNPFTY